MSLIRHTLRPDADGRLQLDLPELAGQDLEIIVRPARPAAKPRAWQAGVDPVPPSGKVVGVFKKLPDLLRHLTVHLFEELLSLFILYIIQNVGRLICRHLLKNIGCFRIR